MLVPISMPNLKRGGEGAKRSFAQNGGVDHGSFALQKVDATLQLLTKPRTLQMFHYSVGVIRP